MTKKQKNRMRKTLTLIVSAILLVSISVGVTIAYLTDHETVTNTFTVGKVQIKLDEAQVDNAGATVAPSATIGTNGSSTTVPARTISNEYHLLPGHTYVKDPTVTVLAGSDASYIKMTVTVNNADDLDAIFKAHNIKNLADVFSGYDSSKWKCVSNTKANDTRTYVFQYVGAMATDATKKTVSALEADVVLEPLFKEIKVPSSLTNEDFEKIEDLKITVNAYAIQADGFDTADAAWAAFAQQNS